jgi:hypothetical protein
VSISRSGTSKDATDGAGLGKASFRAIDGVSRFSVIVTRFGPSVKAKLAIMHHSMIHEIMSISKPSVFHFLMYSHDVSVLGCTCQASIIMLLLMVKARTWSVGVSSVRVWDRSWNKCVERYGRQQNSHWFESATHALSFYFPFLGDHAGYQPSRDGVRGSEATVSDPVLPPSTSACHESRVRFATQRSRTSYAAPLCPSHSVCCAILCWLPQLVRSVDDWLAGWKRTLETLQ